MRPGNKAYDRANRYRFRSTPTTPGQIYILHAPSIHALKIGWSRVAEKRIKELRRVIPLHLDLIELREGTRVDEKALHDRHIDHLIHGEEWFDDCILASFS